MKSQDTPPPLVSIIIPTYNYAHYLPHAVESALAQTYPKLEIIVIDDGSTDDTVKAIAPYRERIQYIYQSNAGLSAARNMGLDVAKGEFVLFLDSDDFIKRKCVEKQIQHLLGDGTYNFVVCNSRYFYDKFSCNLKPTIGNFVGWRIPQKSNVLITLCFHNIAPPHAFLTRKSTIDKHNLRFDTTLKACEDYDFWLKLAFTGGAPALESGVHVLYRQHRASMSKRYTNQYHHDVLMVKRIQEILRSKPVCVDTILFECMIANLASCATAWNLLKPEKGSFYYKELSSVSKHILNQIGGCSRPTFLKTHFLERLGHEIQKSSFQSNLDILDIKNFYQEMKKLYRLSPEYVLQDVINNQSISTFVKRAYYILQKPK